MIRVQREDFDVGHELERLAAGEHMVGGIASFIGLVRDFNLQRGGPANAADTVSAPARFRSVVLGARLDPAFALGRLLALPERRLGL